MKSIKAVLSLIITYFLSVWFYISCEKLSFSYFKKNLFQIIPIIFWILFYFGFHNDLENFENIEYFILTLFGIIWYLFIAPYIKNILSKQIKQSIFYTYFYKISVIFLISAILWWILLLLWTIWISSIFSLFDLNWINYNKFYQDWAIISLFFIPPIFALTQIPEKKSYNQNHFNENIFFSFLVKYIAIPFIYIYFIILYAYSIKVLINFWDWPKGEVSWMVIWFSIFGYFTFIYSYIFEQRNKFITTFRKAFPYVVIPQLFMLFYAIYLRIAQYDITANRYFVVIFWIWLFCISIYYIISKKKHLWIIPFLLTIFIIIISIWPWSVYKLPETRQLNRLEKNLVKAWIKKESKIIPLNTYEDIDKELSKNIYSQIKYLCDYNNCDQIKQIFNKQYQELLKKDKKIFEKRQKKDLEYYKDNKKELKKINKRIYNEPSNWSIINEITKKIKVKKYYSNSNTKNQETISFHLSNNEQLFPINIKWYSKILTMNNYENEDKLNEFAKININKKNIEIIKNKKVIDTINIKDFINNLYKNHLKDKDTLIINDLSLEINNYKVIFEYITIKNPEYKWDKQNIYTYAHWYILIK